MTARYPLIPILILIGSNLPIGGAESASPNLFGQARTSAQQQLEESLAELARLREEIAKEKILLSKQLSDLENQLIEVRREFQQTTRQLDVRTLDLNNLRTEIQGRRDEQVYLSTLLAEYIRNFESRLHIAEIQRYSQILEAAKLAPENRNLSENEVYRAQTALVVTSLERLHEALGGTRFEGKAVDPSGLVSSGTILQVGPAALFLSQDGKIIGTVEQRIGSLEPTVMGFESQELAQAATEVVTSGFGRFPFDPTLGNAHQIEGMKETVVEHIRKGGPVMVPILGLGFAALVVALVKWVQVARVRKPSEQKVNALLQAVAERDEHLAAKAKAVGGLTGEMLRAAVQHIQEPPELIEEVMYEKVLTAKLRLQRWLPFVGIGASCAPLLGLLGTVTGIINTFKLITVYGSGDPKTLSSGISEALITTEYGLIVAIPSLLIHAMLSRKTRGVIDRMEKYATAFMNQLAKTPYRQEDSASLLEDMPAAVAREVLRSLDHQERVGLHPVKTYSKDSAGGMMDQHVIRVPRTATVAEAIASIRAAAEEDEDITDVFVVNEQGRFVGNLPIHRLLIRSDKAPIEALVNKEALSVRVDADRQEVRNLFKEHDLTILPVVDHDNRLVGYIARNGE